MSNDHGRDYGAGLSGQGAENVTDRDAYAAGQGARQAGDASQARIDGTGRSSTSVWGSQPKVNVSPIGCAAILVAPALFVIYPLAGLIAAAGLFAGIALGELIFSDNVRMAQLLLGVVAMFALVPIGSRVETYANQFLIYRWLRWPIRLGVLGYWLVLMILTNGQLVTDMELQYAWEHASLRTTFYCYAAVPIVLGFSLFIDYFVFPAMGVAPARLAKRAEKAALAEQAGQSEAEAAPAQAQKHISVLPIFGYLGLAIFLAYVTPFNLGETVVLTAALVGAVIWYRRRRSA